LDGQLWRESIAGLVNLRLEFGEDWVVLIVDYTYFAEKYAKKAVFNGTLTGFCAS
jgi:hypothetical protein